MLGSKEAILHWALVLDCQNKESPSGQSVIFKMLFAVAKFRIMQFNLRTSRQNGNSAECLARFRIRFGLGECLKLLNAITVCKKQRVKSLKELPSGMVDNTNWSLNSTNLQSLILGNFHKTLIYAQWFFWNENLRKLSWVNFEWRAWWPLISCIFLHWPEGPIRWFEAIIVSSWHSND